MKDFTVIARGKINLSLNITGACDCMHTLDSVIASVDVFDTVQISFDNSGDTRAEFYSGEGKPTAIPPVNSVTKAVDFLRKYISGLGATVKVVKGIPMGGGLGGSSADASAVIAAARFAFGLDESVVSDCVAVGSDVPMTSVGGYLRVGGIGEKITRLNSRPLNIVIASYGDSVNSGSAYSKFDELYPQKRYCPSDNDLLAESLNVGDISGIAKQISNALYEPVKLLCPKTEKLISRINGCGAIKSFLTGSGGCCCGLFDCAESAAEAAEQLRRKGLYAVSTVTGKIGCEIKQN